MPTLTVRVKDRESGLAFRVETLGCYGGKKVCSSALAILLVYFEQEFHGWFFSRRSLLASQPVLEYLRHRSANGSRSPRAYCLPLLQTTSCAAISSSSRLSTDRVS